MKKVAVLASGSGSNFEAIANAAQASDSPYEVVALITNRADAFALERAKSLSIPSYTVLPNQFHNKVDYEQDILAKLRAYDVDWIALAGYMRIVGPTLLEPFRNRIINVHPSLLPQFPGKDAIEQALAAGVSHTGVTVHYIDEGVDTGPMIAQQSISIAEFDTYNILQMKLREVEHILYPQTLKHVIREDELIEKNSVN
ncbi:phosphoribosylglycinamide formyltransferase-1 [Alkalibacillus flavidus]|uniref:Phosphoribosylglycinamide formyltransferase n=1 Tax=Alkalibacillus flavidus TaxID=546021 RepID=A0ABV2KWM3_9BACI